MLHVVETWRPVSSGYTSRGWHIVSAQSDLGLCVPQVLASSRQALHDVHCAEMPAGASGTARVVPVSLAERALRRLRAYYVDGRHLARAIALECRRESIDLIHCHWSSTIGAAAWRASRKTGAALVAEVRFDLAGAMMSETVRRDIPALEKLLRMRFERYVGQADAVVAASHALADLVRRGQGDDGPPVHVIPNAVDRRRFSPALDAGALRRELGMETSFVVGSTTNMLRYEGLDILLDAVEKLRDSAPRLRVLLVGGGTQQAALARASLARGLPITFTGRVPSDEIPVYLNLFDLFVIPRRAGSVTRYASPIKLMEALACGLPVVGSRLGDIPDILAKAGGTVVAPDDANALAEAISRFVGDPVRVERARASARAWARGQPSWDDLACRYQPIYEQALVAASARRGH